MRKKYRYKPPYFDRPSFEGRFYFFIKEYKQCKSVVKKSQFAHHPPFGYISKFTNHNRMEEIKVQKWYEYVNYRRCKNEDGTFSYFIIIDGTRVEVSEVIYMEYARASQKMRYIELDIKCSRFLKDKDGKAITDDNNHTIILPERESPLDKLISENNGDFPSDEILVEEVALLNIEIERLHEVLSLLTVE